MIGFMNLNCNNVCQYLDDFFLPTLLEFDILSVQPDEIDLSISSLIVEI